MFNSKTLKRYICLLLAALLVVFSFAGCGEKEENADNNNETENSGNTFAGFSGDYTPTDKVKIEIKDYGTITVALDATKAPITVENFKNLVTSGFYDGLTLHRIMKDFMMQGGDPEGTGMGGSGKEIKGEFINNGVNNPLSHKRGAISMARNSISMDSASSQFFICHQDATFLDGDYACFGYVTEGMDIVDKICTDAKPTDNNGTIPKENQPIITKISIEK